MDDILLVKGAAMEASPSFTITDCSCASLSISFRIFCNFARVFTGAPPSALGLFLGPFMDDKVSFLESSRLSESILSGGLDRIATPARKKKRKTSIFTIIYNFYRFLFVNLPTWACFKAPTSFVPSPHINVVYPRDCSDTIMNSFCFGAHRAKITTCGKNFQRSPRCFSFRYDKP